MITQFYPLRSNFKMLSKKQIILFVFSCLILFSLNLPLAAAGVLDLNFGNGGKVNFRFGETSDFATSAVLQPDGKIVIVGSTVPSMQSNRLTDFIAARLNTDGSLDNTFGSGGLVATAFGFQEDDSATSVILQPNGKIVVGGYSGNVFALARYNSDGSLDNSFGGGGKVTTNFPESFSQRIDFLFLQADGKILAVGNSFSGSGSVEGRTQIPLARYNVDGSLDSTFENNGRFKIFFGNLLTTLSGAAMQPDGKLLISGRYEFNRPNCTPVPVIPGSCSDTQEFLLRYNQNMSLDRKFGRRFGKEFSGDRFLGLSLQSDGNILVGGFPLVRRYSANGRLETTFDRAVFPNQPPNQSFASGPYKLRQRPNGTIVGCQYLRAVGHDDIGVVLFSPAGRAIAYDQRDFFGADDNCRDILIQSDSKIIVVGNVRLQQQGNSTIGVMRYLDITP
jgi:uncharacterized delta-60 repeat protein